MRLDPRSAELGGGACIRPLEEADVPALFALVEANREHLRAWLPWLDHTRKEDDARAWARERIERAEAGKSAEFVILDGDRHAGVIGFNEVDWPNRSTLIGYWLARDRQGRGLVTRAVAELVRWAFEELELNRVAIEVATGNAGSRAVAVRLGFRHEGTLREAEWLYDRYVDLDVFSLLAPEWQAAKAGESLRPHPRLRRAQDA